MQGIDWGKLHNNKNLDFYNDDAGLHVHLNRKAFTRLHLWNFCRFLYNHLTLTTHIARRHNNNFEWCNFSGHLWDDIRTAIKSDGVNAYRGAKRTAINLSKNETIELRMFGGSESGYLFNTKIEFIQAVYDFTKTYSLNEKHAQIRFVEHVNADARLTNLQKYLKSNESKKAILRATDMPDFLADGFDNYKLI